ncbi:hypothetical protein D9M69_622960 [compost metagenome]
MPPLHQHQRQDDLVHAAPQHHQQHQRHQDGREAQDEVHDAHKHGVDQAAHIGGHEADRAADGGGQHHGGQAHHQADAQAIQNGAEHVAALVIGAEPGDAAVHQRLARRQAAVHQG